MVVLQLQNASLVDSLASTRTNPDICKSPVYRDLSQAQPQNGSEVSSGKLRVCSHMALVPSAYRDRITATAGPQHSPAHRNIINVLMCNARSHRLCSFLEGDFQPELNLPR